MTSAAHSPDQVATRLALLGAHVLATYSDSVLASLDSSSRAAAASEGFAFHDIPDRTMTGRGLFVFDSRGGEPFLPAQLRIDPRTNPGHDLYIVQFVGPIEDAWVDAIERLGVRVFDYLPAFSYIAAMPPGTVDKVLSLEFVQWVGAYEPGYKISSALLYGADPVSAITVTVLPGRSVGRVIEALQFVGGIVDSGWSASPGWQIQALVPASAIAEIAQMREVSWIEPTATYQLLNDQATWVMQSGKAPNPSDPTSGRDIYARGITGAGQIVTIADTGVDYKNFSNPRRGVLQIAQEMFLDPSDALGTNVNLHNDRKIFAYIAPSGSTNPGDDLDQDGHGTHVAGSIAGDAPQLVNGAWTYGTYNKFDGNAIGARLFVEDIKPAGHTTAIFPPTDFTNMFLPAWQNGSEIHSNSWGGGLSTYASPEATIDTFVAAHPSFLILYAAGNNGPMPSTVSGPANAKDIITVGALANGVNETNLATGPLGRYFSARGPTGDGRLGPTLLAPGMNICSAAITSFNDTTSPGWCSSGDWTRGQAYIRMVGTSMATPAVAGAAALVRQYLAEGWLPLGTKGSGPALDASAALVKAILINGAVEVTGADAYGQTSPASNNFIAASTDTSTSPPYALNIIKCAGGNPPGCPLGDNITNQYYARAFSAPINFNTGLNYAFDEDFYLPQDIPQYHLQLLDDGAVGLGLFVGGANGTSRIVFDAYTEIYVASGQWHHLHLDYAPGWYDPLSFRYGRYNATLDGVRVATGIDFNGPATGHLSLGSIDAITGPTGADYGDVYYDNLMYSAPSGAVYYTENFTDPNLPGWTIQTGPVPEYRYPNDEQGWGRVNLDNSLYFAGDARHVVVDDSSTPLATGQSRQYQYAVADSTTPLTLTLVWSDVAGTPGAARDLVNDLDLSVMDPAGHAYRGNVFPAYATLEDKQANPGQSVLGGVPDRLNNVEEVLRLAPQRGVWTVTVSGYNVPLGPQAYALVASGNFSTNFSTLATLPYPFANAGVLSGNVVVGSELAKVCKRATVANGATTADDIGAVEIAGGFGNVSKSGTLGGLLDTEAVPSACTLSIATAGNLFVVGGQSVNLLTKAVNPNLPVRFASSGDGSGQGIYASGSRRNYVRTVNPDGSLDDYGFLSMYHDPAAQRSVYVVAGLTTLSTRSMSELVAQNLPTGALPADPYNIQGTLFQGTGVVVRLHDVLNDGRFETYQIVDGTGGAIAMPLSAFYPRPYFILQIIVLGQSSAHLGLGAASMTDAAAAIPLAAQRARVYYTGTVWAVIDTEAVDSTGKYVTMYGNFLSIGPKSVNAVSNDINILLYVRFVDKKGICTTNNGGATVKCYQKSGTYGKGTLVTDYAMDSQASLFTGQLIEVVAGLSNQATRGTAKALAAGSIDRGVNRGVVVKLVDLTGDGVYESVVVVDSA